MLLLVVALLPALSVTVTLTVKLPAPPGTTATVTASAVPVNAWTIPPPSAITQCTDAMLRPCATALVAALSAIVSPATGDAGADGSTTGEAPQLGHLRSVVGLVWRSVVLWMLLVALLTLANLVG